MKKLLIGLMFTGVVVAEEDRKLTKSEMCEFISEIATQTMVARQRNVSMVAMYRAMEDSDLKDPFKEVTLAIIRDAYKQPKYYTDDMIDGAVTDFTNEVFTVCLEKM